MYYPLRHYLYHYNHANRGGAIITAFDLENKGAVTGVNTVGGIGGYGYSESGSTWDSARILNSGTITATGEEALYGEIFATSSNVALQQ